MISTSKLDKFFGISQRGSTVGTEVRAGLTTFATMAYILVVNPSILSDAGLDFGAVFVATALASVLATVLMGLMAGLPFALAPGMGLNAFFAYSVVLMMGYSPSFALAAVFVEGILFIILSVSGIRTKLFTAIPSEVKIAVSAGIGLFIAFIGLQNANIIIADPATLVTMNPNLLDATVALAIIGVVITLVLWLKKVKGALIIGILATWILGMLAQLSGWYVVAPDAGTYSLIPSGVVSAPPSMASTFGLFIDGFREAFGSTGNLLEFLTVMLTFLYVDLFDSLGTFAGVATKAKLIDEHGNLPGADKALLADAIGTTVGAVLGTSTITTFVESSAGVEEGGRTGLTSIVTAICFLLAIPFFPIISVIPGFATAPALIIVGVLMFEVAGNLDFQNSEHIFPAFVTIVLMPLGYSISAGLMWGILTWLLVKIINRKASEVSPVMWVLGVLFLAKLLFIK